MGQFTVVLVPLEMLLVNLFMIHSSSERKYRLSLTFVSMGLFACALSYLIFEMTRGTPGYGGGSGLFVFGGFLFFIPIKLLYKLPGVRIVTITCFSWAYTFLLFAFSVRFGNMYVIPGWTLAETVLFTQTILYIFTLRIFYHLLKTKFMFIMDNIGKNKMMAFMWVSMVWFWTVFIINLSFAFPEYHALKVLTFLTLGVCIFISYRYIYLQVSGGKTIQSLEKIAYQDELTQLQSRVVLYKDACELIARKIPFHLIFFDLDNFKNINDRYSHQVGDRYLAFFAHEIKTRIGNCGGLYRIAGDEFISIMMTDDVDDFFKKIKTLPDALPDSHVKFLGFSYGIASFPQDGETAEKLLHCADLRMYAMKRPKKRALYAVPVNAEYYGTG